MKKFALACCLAAPLLVAAQSPPPAVTMPKAAGSHAPAAAVMTSAEQTAVVKQHCAGCHSERGKAGGLSLATFDATDVVEHGEVSEKMIRKLRAGMMPPAGARRPEPAVITALATAFETRIDRAAALSPNPGWRPSQRLNRAEHGRAVKDLLAVDVDVTAYCRPTPSATASTTSPIRR